MNANKATNTTNINPAIAAAQAAIKAELARLANAIANEKDEAKRIQLEVELKSLIEDSGLKTDDNGFTKLADDIAPATETIGDKAEQIKAKADGYFTRAKHWVLVKYELAKIVIKRNPKKSIAAAVAVVAAVGAYVYSRGRNVPAPMAEFAQGLLPEAAGFFSRIGNSIVGAFKATGAAIGNGAGYVLGKIVGAKDVVVGWFRGAAAAEVAAAA